MAITYEEALRGAEDWAMGRCSSRDLAFQGDLQEFTYMERIRIAELDAQESIKWSTLALAIAAGGPETKAGQR